LGSARRERIFVRLGHFRVSSWRSHILHYGLQSKTLQSPICRVRNGTE
jgi:hypothetical protein